MRKLKIIISIAAVLISTAHLIWPDVKIDSITLGLIIIAILPWLAPIFKSVELPGGMKFELQDFQKIEEKAEKAGLLAHESEVKNNEYSFQTIAKEDPLLALAGLRIELEKRLRNYAEMNQLDVNRKGFGQIIKVLSEHELINFDERGILNDLAGTLNHVVHSDIDSLDYRTVQWALDVGPRIIKTLEKRIN